MKQTTTAIMHLMSRRRATNTFLHSRRHRSHDDRVPSFDLRASFTAYEHFG